MSDFGFDDSGNFVGIDYTPVDNFNSTDAVAPPALDNSNAYSSPDGGSWLSLNNLLTTGGAPSMDGTVMTIPTVPTATYVPVGTSGTSLTAQGASGTDWARAILGALGAIAPAVTSVAVGSTPAVTSQVRGGNSTATPSTHTLLMVGVAGVLVWILLKR